jgi:ketosteroid isomerase-like protein
MTGPDVERTLQAYFAGVNEERFADVAALFTEDGELHAPGLLEPRRGHADIADYYGAALRPYPEHRDEPTRTIVAGATATVEIHFSGALAGGARLEFDAVDVFDLADDGRIVRLSSWYDSHAVRQWLRAQRESRS